MGGNPNQFDMQKLFKPPIPASNPNPNSNVPFVPPASYSAGATHLPYSPVPSPGSFTYPPSTPFHHHPFIHYPQETLHRPGVSYPVQPSHTTNSNLSTNSTGQNPGARLMALLGNSSPSQLDFAASMPISSPTELSAPLHAAPSAPPAVMVASQALPTRIPSTKVPRGWHLGGERVVHDVESRLPGETQLPQLEVTPITKYTSDPGLVLGRQIAVNKTYICYGLKLGAIRVLNINTALRSLLRGHSQRVTDMAFFAEEVHLLASASVDGKVFIWKIEEGPDHEDKPQITGKLVLAIQLIGDREFHPRICWHSHKQEILVVGIANSVLKIDTSKVGRGIEFSADEPLKCPFEQLIDGVQLVGRHDTEVTDLSISQWMATRIASASNDGTVKIWDVRKSVPLATLRPHEGNPVHSVSFLTSPHRPDHIVLLTSGPLNREVKLWTSTAEDGWLLPSDSDSWRCNQTLELRSSTEPRAEEAFFNQVVVLPQENLVLLANAKKNAIYAVHIDYGPYPAATFMDYIADFTVTMPILSLTGTSDIFPDGEHVVQVYCVQTQAIQQYALNLSQCLPPVVDSLVLAKDSVISHAHSGINSEGYLASDISHASSDIPLPGASPIHSVSNSEGSIAFTPVLISSEVKNNAPDLPLTSIDVLPSAPPLPTDENDNLHRTPSSNHLNLDSSGNLLGFKDSSKNLELECSLGKRDVYQELPINQTELRDHNAVGKNANNATLIKEDSGSDNVKSGPSDINVIPNSPLNFRLGGKITHLITPFEILSGVKSSSEVDSNFSSKFSPNQRNDEVNVLDLLGNKDLKPAEVLKTVDESVMNQFEDFNSKKETMNDCNESTSHSLSSSISNIMNDMPKDGDVFNVNFYDDSEAQGDYAPADDSADQFSRYIGENVLKNTVGISHGESGFVDIPASKDAKGKKQKVKQSRALGLSSPTASPFNSIDSSNKPGCSMEVPFTETALSQIVSIQEVLNQILLVQKEMHKHISTAVILPITKEGKRIELALGKNTEKCVKANSDALWARFLEENAKREKAEKDRLQQITNLMTNFINKDFPSMLEKALKKEISSIGSSLSRLLSPVIEKTVSSAITDSFQRGVGDKACNQLEKSVNTKLDLVVTRQIQAQFQTTGRHALQDALRNSFESSLIPAFEQSCKAMFEQVDTAFHKGMSEHNAAALQQFESAHTPLALTLRDAINSASSFAQNLSSELVDGQRKLLALVSGNAKSLNPMIMQQNNGSMGGGLPEMALSVQQVEAPLDPTKELSRLISEGKYDEAFTAALQRSDVSIVSWLCSQVDVRGICSMTPLPLNQGVILALLQQLACDISNDTEKKLLWMTDVAAAINPTDPIISSHVRPIFEQVYSILAHVRTLPSASATEACNIRIIGHVINSVLMSCK